MKKIEIIFSTKMVGQFCKLTGDNNEIHTNDKVAKNIGMRGSIVNGALTLSQGIGLLIKELNSSTNKPIILESNSKYKKELLVGEKCIYEIEKKDSYLNDTVHLYEISVSPLEIKEKGSIPSHIHRILLKLVSID